MICLASSFTFQLLIQIIWPKQLSTTTLMGVLFAVFPGFLQQPSAVAYAPHLMSLTLGLFSIALSIWVLLTDHKVLKWSLIIGGAVFVHFFMFKFLNI